jgi:hypothetical protein
VTHFNNNNNNNNNNYAALAFYQQTIIMLSNGITIQITVIIAVTNTRTSRLKWAKFSYRVHPIG